MNDHREPEGRSPLRRLFGRPLPLESETSWFLLFGVLDLILTTMLFATGAVREVNPLARFCIQLGGLHGLILFKCGMLAVVTGLVQIIALRHARVARAVLHTGLAVTFAVVIYSATLLLRLAV